MGKVLALLVGAALAAALLLGGASALPGGVALPAIFVAVPAVLLAGVAGERLIRGRKR